MDDILICSKTKNYFDSIIKRTVTAIEEVGFKIALAKIQPTCQWEYLSFLTGERTIVPQNTAIKDDSQTLRDLQQLCGSINWIRSLLGLTTEELASVFDLLRGDNNLELTTHHHP